MEPKTSNLNVELPAELVAKVKQLAKDRGVLLRRLVQDALAAAVNGKKRKSA